VTRKRYRRLTRFAAMAALDGTLLLLAIFGPIPWAPVSLLVLLLWLWAWGHYQADITLNPNLDDGGRLRWRVVLGLTPYGIVVYWLREVRGRRAFD
jgi:hypothetical protein